MSDDSTRDLLAKIVRNRVMKRINVAVNNGDISAMTRMGEFIEEEQEIVLDSFRNWIKEIAL